jgi:hypothetical protein
MYIDRPESLILTNNTITSNTAIDLLTTDGLGGGLFLLLFQEADQAFIYNNIFWNNSAADCTDMAIDNDGDSDFNWSPVLIYNNDFDQSETGFCITQTVFPIDPGNIDNEDPLFVSSASDNYRLQEFSPAIDNGTFWANAPATDFDGIVRPIGGQYDIGAYESIYTCDTDPVLSDSQFFSSLTECYSTLYGTGSGSATIKCHAITLMENMNFSEDWEITLDGGYDCDYMSNTIPGYQTTIDGVVNIQGGSVVMNGIVIR